MAKAKRVITLPVAEEFTFGNGGWVRYRREGAIPVVYLRFAESEQGRLEIVELYLPDNGRLTGDILRTLRLNQIEASVNGEHASDVRRKLSIGGPDIAKDLPGHAGKDAPLGEIAVEIDARLNVPKRRPYPEDFYRSVAHVYMKLARHMRAPAEVIADANPGISVVQVHEWVKVARNRYHFLPAAQKGRIS